jgi:LacI family transcriptional regulator
LTTISDVARLAGVSPVTVSRVINNADNVSPATRERVERAIAELGYVPSGVAKSLRLKRTQTLALIVPDIQNSFWTTVARGVEDAAHSRGYSIFLCNTDENAAKQRHYLEVVISQRADGVIIAPSDNKIENLELLRKRRIPTVVMDRYIDGWDVDTVMGDSVSAARALVKHLIDLGHERIAMISGPQTTSTSIDRIIGYRIALAEAGIEYDPDLIRIGEYRSISGERLTHQLLESERRPSAIFAANNVIALGVIDALSAHGLRVPQDMALVCFDDLPNTSRLFPFLTVAVQPAYDLGANAAQLLLSRLESEQLPPPRHVILPTRLIIRHSCGATLSEPDLPTMALPQGSEAYERTELVKPLTPEERNLVSSFLNDANFVTSRNRMAATVYEKPDASRIAVALRFEQPDRTPHVEFALNSPRLFRYVLGRKGNGGHNGSARSGRITPEDRAGFARRMGLDAIICDFSRNGATSVNVQDDVCRMTGRPISRWSDLDQLEKPVVIAEQLNKLERHLRAADGLNLGVFVGFDSFFDCALRAVGGSNIQKLFADRFFFERLLDILLDHQERVMQAVCDRFADDISFVLVRDVIANDAGSLLGLDRFSDVYFQRMQRLIAPARDHELPVAISSPGAIVPLLPMLHEIGFDIVHPTSLDYNGLRTAKETWQDKLIFAGGVSADTLRHGDQETIQQQVIESCRQLSADGGYIFGVSGAITDDIPPENYVVMTQALHQHGRNAYLRPVYH